MEFSVSMYRDDQINFSGEEEITSNEITALDKKNINKKPAALSAALIDRDLDADTFWNNPSDTDEFEEAKKNDLFI